MIGGGPNRCAIPIQFNFHADEWSQESLESQRPGATVIPIIVSTDKTQLTTFGGKQAYPVYMTIRNIPKDICRKPSRGAQMLVGYIPTTKLEGISVKAARHRALTNLFHGCMQTLLGPLVPYGETGLPMMSRDGTWCQCYPLLASFVGDYPEQILVTCIFYGECPKCEVPWDQLGDLDMFASHNLGKALRTFALADGNICTFHAACRDNGIKPVFHPFWESLPHADIYVSVTPNILHQLLQGVMKHIIAWLSDPLVFRQWCIDAQCHLMPLNHQTTLFPRGITMLSHVSGKEHKNMCQVLLGLIVDLPLTGSSSPAHILKAVHSLLDFLYLAQLPSQTTDTILHLEHSLVAFHENKDIFVDLGVWGHFNVPKIHSLLHYSPSICLFSTTDNYNTKQTEHLHIDFTKDAYRTTNHKDVLPQMTTWLEQCEKVQQHAKFLDWQQQQHLPTSAPPQRPFTGPPRPITCYLKMAQNPTLRRVSFEDITHGYGAIAFQDLLGDFLKQVHDPSLLGQALHNCGRNTLIPFHHVPVFHKIKFINGDDITIDSIHIRPEQVDAHRQIIPARFNTVLVWTGGWPDNAHRNQGRLLFDHHSRDLADFGSFQAIG